MRRLGQHFLKDKRIAETIARALDIQSGETVIEIGPGHGELTGPLLTAVRRAGGGAAVIAIERDSALVPALAARCGRPEGSLMVIEGDALGILPDIAAKVASMERERERKNTSYVIAGNIPYYITGKLLRILSELPEKPRAAALMVQKEVAERMCAAPPEMNRLAASVQFWAETAILKHVPKGDFAPPPGVDSAVVMLTVRTAPPPADPAHYYRVVRGLFAQPRKTILNNALAMAGGKLDKTHVIAELKNAGIDPEARPQNLDIHLIAALARLKIWG